MKNMTRREMLKSVPYKLRDCEGLLHHIGEDVQKTENFIKNSFNESIHLTQKGELKDYLQWVAKLIPEVYTETEHIQDLLPGKDKPEKSVNQLYGLLRTLSFIRGEDA